MPKRPVTVPPPKYASWEQYLNATTARERRAWAARKAKKANQKRLLSEAPDVLLTADDVLGVMTRAQGRCARCGSLAVEPRPSNKLGHPLPWEPVGRRIGSLGHIRSRVGGGSNAVSNLEWSCLWCNTWPNQGIPGAIDHGAVQDGTFPATTAPEPRLSEEQVREVLTATDRFGAPVSDGNVAAAWTGDLGSGDWKRSPGPPALLDADYWAEVTDPDHPDYLRGTAMRDK